MPAVARRTAEQALLVNVGIRFRQREWDGIVRLAEQLGLSPAATVRKLVGDGLRREPWYAAPDATHV